MQFVHKPAPPLFWAYSSLVGWYSVWRSFRASVHVHSWW